MPPGRYREKMTSAVKDYVFSLDTWRDRFPITRWLPKYRPNNIINDVIAGLTVGLTVIPQGLAYANIAKLPLVVSLAPPLPFSPSTIKRHCTPFHLVCSNYLRKITNLRTFGLKWSVEVLQENSEGKNTLVVQLCVLSPLSPKHCYYRGTRFSPCFITALHRSLLSKFLS